MRRVLATLPALVIALLALVGSVGSAAATTGVAIDVARIDVSQELLAGDAYRLPAFGVRNPGTEATSYRMTVSYLDGQDALRPDASWFEFSPAEITLEPGATRAVTTRLVIPPGAEFGDYDALIGPQIATTGEGATVGAAAAARLTFTVVPSSQLEAWLRWLWRFITENPWLLLIPAAVLLVIAVWFLRRRYAFTISRR